MSKVQKRRGGPLFPMSLFLIVTMAVIILRITHAQPQHFFKANAPVSKSLPRIGRRSDLETFPLSRDDISWSRENIIGGEESKHIRNQQERRGESFVIPFLDEDRVAPNMLKVDQYLWRKLMGDSDISEIRNFPNEDPLRNNMYRARE